MQGLLCRGDARAILNLAYSKKIDLYGSEKSYKEIREVVNYPNFKKYLDKEIYTPEKLLISYKAIVKTVTIDNQYKSLHVVMDDPDDDEFIKIAKTVGAKIIVSRDKHLRKIKKYDDIRIIEPEVFLKIYPSLQGREFR